MKSFYRFPIVVLLTAAACEGREAAETPRPDATTPDAPAATAPAPPPVDATAPAAVGEPAPGPVLAGSSGGSGGAASSGSAPSVTPPAAEQPAGAAEAGTDAAAVLRRAERSYQAIRSLEADFVQEISIPLLDQTQRSRGKVYHRRPDRFLMRFSQPEGDVVVADGEYLWAYYPSVDARQVMRHRIRDGEQQADFQKEFLSDAAERYTAVLQGTQSVGGRPADVLVLTPKGPSPYRRVRIWVDREDALVRRFEITEENESVRTLDLRNLKPNVALSDQLFRFTPPPGAQVFEQ